MPDSRKRAATIVGEIAGRLGDPETVIAATRGRGAILRVNDVPCPPWDPHTLSRGEGALAILYAELGHRDAAYRELAHRYLTLAAGSLRTEAVHGPMEGLGALATATRVAAHGTGGYGTLLSKLDARMGDYASWLVKLHQTTIRDREPTAAGLMDVVSGLAGLGRYFLHRSPDAPVLTEILTSLTALAEPVEVEGRSVPGWWWMATTKTMVGEEFKHGQVNFGLSHGVPGPLALLSLARMAGREVPGQAAAIETMADWLLEWQEKDEHGPYWTAYIPLHHYLDRGAGRTPKPGRPSWCYGAIGTARALELAATALDRPEWTAAGMACVLAMLARPREGWGVQDSALCHGWSGLLLMLDQLRREHPEEPALAGATADIAETLLSTYDSEAPFGFRYFQPAARLHLDLPGLMEGAAGIALALDSYARDAAPVSAWDTVLLVR